MIGGKYNIWIMILQEFDLDFMSAKSKKSLVFAELISKLPCGEEIVYDESFPDEHLFLISPQDPWYGDIILYLAATESTIGMVLVQEEDSLVEHVIYYLN